MSERVANNINIYNQESNFASYNRVFFSDSFNNRILGIPELPKKLPVSALDRRWVIEKKYHNRLDMIAHKWYGSDYVDFMWILMLYNQPILNTNSIGKITTYSKVILPEDEQPLSKIGTDPFADFPTGREIYIPSRTTIQERII